jgi:methylmalonyl-CoA mutase
MAEEKPYSPKNSIRIVTAASLFDGHDVSINIMRRILQSSGAEVIHLGHDRSVEDVVNTAIQEDANAIAMTSYQGGHLEYFKYMFDLLQENGGQNIKIFGGGGGTILPMEIKELEDYGVTKIYHPDEGRSMGLQGMINDLLKKCDYPIGNKVDHILQEALDGLPKSIARLISCAENFPIHFLKVLPLIEKKIQEKDSPPVLGITGTGGAGKSSLVDELVRRFVSDHPGQKIGILSVDPTKRKSGGALLGDRIRMNSIQNPSVYMRSLATRQSNLSLSKHISQALKILKAASFDLIILETSGIGQSDTEILEYSDASLYVMTPEYGASTQLEKIDMLDFADLISLNKLDKRGALDALRDIKKQVQRNQNRWEEKPDDMPVYGTMASQFNDPGTNRLYRAIIEILINKLKIKNISFDSNRNEADSEKNYIIPANRTRYLSEISECVRDYNTRVTNQSHIADTLYSFDRSIKEITKLDLTDSKNSLEVIVKAHKEVKTKLHPANWEAIQGWEKLKKRYLAPEYVYKVRGKDIHVDTHVTSLSNQRIPKVVTPSYRSWGDILRWILQENVPGSFPYTSGIYSFKRKGEDPTRMFAGEGGPERTNKRFHYVSQGTPAKRLSTAFDSVTLYGHDPHRRPDIYGKIGNAGVSVSCLDDAKKLYSGFDLCHPSTSVSMTINGPAPMLLGFFLNAAIDQQCERYIIENNLVADVESFKKDKYKALGLEPPKYSGNLPAGNDGLGLILLGVTGDEVLPLDIYNEIKAKALSVARGTVQSDILKEDQAQNTCIFSTEFALRLMGDVQEYFIDKNVRNFYSVSISGYHIAEAGANPITQLAFTLSNGFTYVEYYLSRGMDINLFGPNLSFFFSNGIDPEYAVIGRVARRIWAKALKEKYGANERSQMLKYHIQTSGRSLHAQEISFNDIRTTLQALYAIYDNCNSLHTNAYDEAITTPTEESVRRAMAIQLIINNELGLAKNENPLQGSFIIEELTELVEEAVMIEFDRITDRGGVLGAMETMYQRGKIQEESMHYEMLKHNGEYPIIGVNTFLSKEGSPTLIPGEVIRATEDEKENQISTVSMVHQAGDGKSIKTLEAIQRAALENKNMFDSIMEASKVCSLGQMTKAMFAVGGQYRRNM